MEDAAPDPAPKPRRRFLRRAGVSLLGLLMMLAIGVGAGLLLLKGQSLTAPQWVQDRIEQRIARELPNARVRFGEMVLTIDDGWVPRVQLRDVQVTTPAGREIVNLNEFKATFALAPLLEGVAQPSDISVSGIFVTLRRDIDGRVRLSGGQSGATGAMAREAATLPGLIAQVDDILSQPALSALRNADVRALTLRFDDARAQRAWTVDGGRLRLARAGDDLTLSADLALLSGGSGVATLAANYNSIIGQVAADFGVSFDGVAASDIASQSPAFAWLGVLQAPISGSVRSGLNEEGRIAPLNAALQIGAGVLQPTAQAKPIPFEGGRSYFSYDPAEALLRFDTVSVRSKWVTGEASGTALLGGLGEAAAFSDMVGQFRLRDVSANPADLYSDPVEIEGADLDFQLKLNPFRLQVGRLQITDRGNTLLLEGGLRAGQDGWHVALDGQMDAIDPARLLALWPEMTKPKTRNWLSGNLLQATVENIDVALRLEPQKKPIAYVAFDYRDATVKFLKSLPPLTDGAGHFSLMGNRLVVAVSDGEVIAPKGGAVDVRGSAFIIPDVSVKNGAPAVVRLNTQSTVTAALSLLNQKPLQVMDKSGIAVDVAQGQARLEGTLAVPLSRKSSTSDVVFHAKGTLRNLATDSLIKDRSLQADRLTVTADNAGIRITGKAELDGVAFDGSWAQPIGAGQDKSALRGLVALNQQALDAFGIALPSGMLSGNGSARIAVDLERGAAPRFAFGSDLQGIRLSVPELAWSKAPNAKGNLQVSGRLGETPRVENLEVSGAGLSATGSVALHAGSSLDRVRFERLQVGDWLDVPVDLVGQGAGKPLQVLLRGGRLDMRRAEFGGSGGGGGSGGAGGPPMQVALDRLQITDTIALTQMRGTFTTGKGLDGTFEALLNGGAPVRGRVIPRNGRSAVRLLSDDAGGVLRSAGLLEHIVGGDLSLTLLPVGSGGAFDGRIRAKRIRVKNAPGIAGLVNAISVVGLINELNGDGIFFEDVEGDFRLTPNRLTLTKASAVGASMGLSMDGIYGLQNGALDMQGVITPVYLLNGIGSVLTRRGEGLIGFNYTLSGPAKSPKVSVNPLSALTPGMFREIFRRAPPEVPVVDGVAQSTLPRARREQREQFSDGKESSNR